MERLRRRLRPRRSERRALEESVERQRRCVRVELERAGASDVCDPTESVDDVDALRPGRECVADRVVEAVDENRQGQAQPSYALARRLEALLDRGVVRDERPLVEVRLELPPVCRVRLCDVDEDCLGSLLVRAMQRLDVARPATKGRSGEAAEDQNDWHFARGERPESYRRAILEAEKLQLGQRVADAKAIRSPETRDGRNDRGALVGRERLGVLGVARIEIGRGHDAGLWR